MKHRISAVLLLSLILSMLFMPMTVVADDGKSILKEMVQSPADYSVGLEPGLYGFLDLLTRMWMGYEYAYGRTQVYLPDWVFWRLGAPIED